MSQDKLQKAEILTEEAKKIRNSIIEDNAGLQLRNQDDEAAYDELVCGYYR